MTLDEDINRIANFPEANEQMRQEYEVRKEKILSDNTKED